MKKPSQVWFVYDGKCPLCTRAAMTFQIKKTAGDLTIVDARSEPDHPAMVEARSIGLSLDEGMVLKLDHAIYHGAEALETMALIGSPSGMISRIGYWLFSSRSAARLGYPVLRGVRNALLAILRIDKIEDGPRT